MLIYPRAKINIGLYVTGIRDDGYHNIESLFFPIGLTGILEFIPDSDLNNDHLSTSGFEIPGNPEENLVLKACSELRKISDLPFRINQNPRSISFS